MLLFLLLKLLYQKVRPAAIMATFLLLSFFGFGAFHDFIKSIFLPKFFTSYTFLLPLFLLIFIVIGWRLKKRNTGYKKLNYFLNFLLVAFSFIELITFFYNFTTQKQKSNYLSKQDYSISPTLSACDSCAKPDIYFIVWDEYSSSECLKNNFQFDNSALDSFLTNQKFFISKKSKSNYSFTAFSIASTLNMNYLDDKGRVNKLAPPKMILQGIKTVKKNELIPILIKEGYTIRNYSVFDLDSIPSETTLVFKPLTEQFLFDETLFGRIRRDIWWHFDKLLPHKKNKVQARLYHNFVEKGLKRLQNTIPSKKDKPLFVYAHFMIPHEPYFMDQNGNFVEDSVLYSPKDIKQAYVQQLIYTNSIIRDIIKRLLSDSSRKKIIIMEGDHGFRTYPPHKEGLKPFENLNCYYFYDQKYTNLYDGISPVNSFRVVLNQYFKQHLPLLPDSCINIRILPYK